jgi:hypothetical protein
VHCQVGLTSCWRVGLWSWDTVYSQRWPKQSSGEVLYGAQEWEQGDHEVRKIRVHLCNFNGKCAWKQWCLEMWAQTVGCIPSTGLRPGQWPKMLAQTDAWCVLAAMETRATSKETYGCTTEQY